MSALGQKRTFSPRNAMSALPPKADIGRAGRDGRFVPKADITSSLRALPNDPAKLQAREVHTVRTSVMSYWPEERLDRRDFMIASITTAGASAALAHTTGAANAQAAATISAASASGTVYTGDTIKGKKVVSALDVNDLEPGKKHLLHFQGVQMPT